MSKRVLIADDAVFARIAVRRVLENAGYEVAGEAENGSMAVELYNDLKPDAVLMDVTMPVLDGLGAAKIILATDPDAVILMCTALDQHALLIDAVKVGVKDFITKPLVPQCMIDGLHKTIGPP